MLGRQEGVDLADLRTITLSELKPLSINPADSFPSTTSDSTTGPVDMPEATHPVV